MRIFSFTLCYLLQAISAKADGWMWVKEYPWVYTVTGQEWAYVHPSATPQIWDRDTWQEGNSSLFSDHGWVWMYNPNFGFSNKSNQWIHFTGHDSNSTFLYSASNNQWSAWDNYNKVSITLDPNDLISFYGYQDFSFLDEYPNAKSLRLSYSFGSFESHSFRPFSSSYLTKIETLQLDGYGFEFKAIKELPNLTHLILNGYVGDISPFADLVNLKSLEISIGADSNLTAIASLSNLTSLKLNGENLASIDFLSNLTNLTSLEVNVNSYEILAALDNHQNLENLKLGHKTEFDKPSPSLRETDSFINFPNLKSLEVSIDDDSNLSIFSNLEKLNHLSIKNLRGRPSPLLFEELKLPNLVSLELDDYYHDINFSALAKLENLSSLTINGDSVSLDPNDTSISSLTLSGEQFDNMDYSKYPNLSSLTITGQFTDTSKLSKFTNLKSLSIKGGIINLSLSSLENLESIDVDGTLVSLSFASLENLNALKINGDISSFSHSNLSRLSELDLSNVQNPKLDLFKGLTNLRKIDLSYSGLIELSSLESFSNLQSLSLSFSQINDITALTKLENLRSIDLRGTQINDITPLTKLENLRSIDLRETVVEDLSALAKLTHLEELHLDNNGFDISLIVYDPFNPYWHLSAQSEYDKLRIRDISFLSALKKLRILTLLNVKNPDPSPLYSLTNLEELHLSGDFTEFSISDFEHLETLSFDGTCSSLKVLSLSNLPKLKKFDFPSFNDDIYQYWSTENISPILILSLNNLPSLSDLSFDKNSFRLCEQIFLSNLPKIESIYISRLRYADHWDQGIFGGEFSSLGQISISNLENLKFLSIQLGDENGGEYKDNTEINLSGVENLQFLRTNLNAEKLKNFNLLNLRALAIYFDYDSDFGDLTFLSNHNKLEYLKIAGKVMNLSSLSDLNQLEKLYINVARTKLDELKPLEKLSGLEELWLLDEYGTVGNYEVTPPEEFLEDLKKLLPNTEIFF